MAEQKIFAGPRIRRLRHELKLTQSAMARELGVSPSYLNLIERNQRPLTVQLLLRMSAAYEIDLAALRGADKADAALREVFADPLLAGEIASTQELVEIAEAAPNAAEGIVKLYRAYRESRKRLSDLSLLLALRGQDAAAEPGRMPFDEVRELFERRENFFPAIDAAAEAFHEKLMPGGDLAAALHNWLRERHDISVRRLPAQTMPLWRRRFDRHSMRLFISDRLSPFDQQREVAIEACLLELAGEIEAQLGEFDLSSDEARRLARWELARYAGNALMMPYGQFAEAAVRASYDIDALCGRFAVSFEHVANRLTTLRRAPGTVPFFLMEVDVAGNHLRRAGSHGFPQARFGGYCPKLPVHDAFSQPGRIIVERSALPDGSEFLLIARTIEGPRGEYRERVRRSAILLGCDFIHANETVYGASLSPAVTQIGPACRVCERQGCLARAEPPVTRPLGLDGRVSGMSPFDFQ